MLRYSCDLCGRDLCPGVDTRFVVKIEVYPASDPAELTDADLTTDALENLADLLQTDGPGGDDAAEIPPARSSHRYDLCPKCHARYVRSPLKRENENVFQFSKN